MRVVNPTLVSQSLVRIEQGIQAAVAGLVVGGIRAYQLVVSPWLGPACRYEPSCSHFAIEAIRRHGVVRGSWHAARRLGRCHPLGSSGYDPVP